MFRDHGEPLLTWLGIQAALKGTPTIGSNIKVRSYLTGSVDAHTTGNLRPGFASW